MYGGWTGSGESAMDDKMTKGEILGLIRVEWEALEKTLRELDEAQMTEPGVESDWSDSIRIRMPKNNQATSRFLQIRERLMDRLRS